jgi:hypothetical protein
MNTSAPTRAMMRNYLLQQAAQHDDVSSLVEDQENQAVDGIDELLLEEFKNQVKVWWELDTNIKRLQNALREYKKKQSVMSGKILEFMQRYNIEDLNTKYGVLRCKQTYVKAPLSQKTVKEKLFEHFSSDPRAVELLKQIFEERDKKEKVSLRRLGL